MKQISNKSGALPCPDLQPRTKPVETHNTKIPIFFTQPDKNAYRRKLKDRFPPLLLQCCLR